MKQRAHLAKAALYINFAKNADNCEMLERLRMLAQDIAANFPQGANQIVGGLIRDMPTLPHQMVMAKSPKPFDAIYQLSAGNAAVLPAMTSAVAELASRLDMALDRSSSAVLVGREIAITSGGGPIFNVMPLRRLPTLTHEEFMAHWYDRHADLGEGVEGVRYRQNHLDYSETERLAAQLGLNFEAMDGLTESYFDGVTEAVEILSCEEVAVGALDDERLFIDHNRSQFGLYKTLWSKLS